MAILSWPGGFATIQQVVSNPKLQSLPCVLQDLSVYRRRELPGRLWGAELHDYYSQLLAKFGIGTMRW